MRYHKHGRRSGSVQVHKVFEEYLKYLLTKKNLLLSAQMERMEIQYCDRRRSEERFLNEIVTKYGLHWSRRDQDASHLQATFQEVQDVKQETIFLGELHLSRRVSEDN